MVNYTAIDNYTSNECVEPVNSDNSTHKNKQGEFPWDADKQSLLLGGFFYGYVLTQLLGGFVAEIIGAKLVLLITVLGPSVVSLFTPLMAKWNFNALLVSRILMGIAQGPLYPANNVLWSRWAPDQEKTTIVTIVASGQCVGYLLCSTITGILCSLTLLGGWPLSFYLVGGVGVIWSVLWLCIAHSGPEDHPGISEYEKQHIIKQRSYIGKEVKFSRPWRSFFTSGAVWAFFLYSIFDGLASYALFSGVPVYMKQILQFDISQEGLMFALPYVSQMVVFIFAGFTSDWLRKNYFSTATTRKLFCLIGEGGQALFVLGIAFVPCNRTIAVLLYALSSSFIGFVGSGPFVNLLDIAPKYSGTLMGIANLLENVGGFLSPLIIGAITKESPDRKDWQLVFYLTSGAYALATLVFMLLAKGEVQSWAMDTPEIVMTVNADDTQYNEITPDLDKNRQNPKIN